MKRLRLGFLIFLIIASWLFPLSNPNTASAAEQKQTENVCFQWAFGALVGDKGHRKLVSITRDTSLTTGDQFKMLVVLKKKSFVYLIYYSGQGEIQLLFPNGLKQFSDNYKIAEKYYIPQGDLWFALDEKTGLERFYLLASAKRLKGLEDLLNAYESADPTGKSVWAHKIIAEIRKIKRQHKKLTAAAERPVSIGGTVRGIKNQPLSSYDIA